MLGKGIIEVVLSFKKVLETSFRAIFEKQVQFIMILEGLIELYNRWMVETCKNAPFDEDLFDSTLVDKASDEHFFEAIVGPAVAVRWIDSLLYGLILALNLKHGAICSISNLASLRKIGSYQYSQRLGVHRLGLLHSDK